MDTIDAEEELMGAAQILADQCFVTSGAGERLPITPDEALGFIVPIMRDHWATIRAIHDGASRVGLAVVKYDPLIVAVDGLGLMKPVDRSYAAIASCFINKYYPGIIRCVGCEDRGCAGGRSPEKGHC